MLKGKWQRFIDKVVLLQEKYTDRIEDCNIQNYDQTASGIDEDRDKELYNITYGFIAVRSNGDISFSCNMDNPYTFGMAYESLKIPKDKKLMYYIELLRKAEEATLKEAETYIVEFDETVDKYIRAFSQK